MGPNVKVRARYFGVSCQRDFECPVPWTAKNTGRLRVSNASHREADPAIDVSRWLMEAGRRNVVVRRRRWSIIVGLTDPCQPPVPPILSPHVSSCRPVVQILTSYQSARNRLYMAPTRPMNVPQSLDAWQNLSITARTPPGAQDRGRQ